MCFFFQKNGHNFNLDFFYAKPNSCSSKRTHTSSKTASICFFLSTTVSLMHHNSSINIWVNEEVNTVNELIRYYNLEHPLRTPENNACMVSLLFLNNACNWHLLPLFLLRIESWYRIEKDKLEIQRASMIWLLYSSISNFQY